MVTTKNSPSTPVTALFLLIGCFPGSLLAESHPYCRNFSANSEHLTTCTAYDSDKVVVAQPGEDWRPKADNLQAGQLLIVPPQSYALSSPIKLPSGAGIMSGAEGLEGFLTLDWASDFSIGSDPVYCLIALGEGSRLTGIDIDSSRLSDRNERYFNEQSALSRGLIYSTGHSSFTISWSSFIGRPEMDAPVLIRNADNRSNVTGGTFHTIRRTWIEGNGSTHAVILDTARVTDSDKKENVSLTQVTLKLNNMPTLLEQQVGVHIKNGCGEVRQNYFIFDDKPQFNDQNRTGLRLEDVDGTKVMGNIFYSQEAQKRENDVAFAFLESPGVTMNTTVTGNSLSDNINVAFSENTASGLGINTEQSVYRQKGIPFFLTRENFFRQVTMTIPPSLSSTLASSVAMPQSGACVAPMYALQNLSATQGFTDEDDIWHHACGLEVDRNEFNLPMTFKQKTCTTCEKNDVSGWIAATAVGWGVLTVCVLKDVALAAYYYIYKPWKTSRMVTDTESLVEK